MAQRMPSGMQKLNAFFLYLAFLVSIASQMSGWGDSGDLFPEGRMEQGPVSAEVPEEAPEPLDDRPDEEGEWFGRIRHLQLSTSPHSLTAGFAAHADDDPSGLPPSVLEPPPPEC